MEVASPQPSIVAFGDAAAGRRKRQLPFSSSPGFAVVANNNNGMEVPAAASNNTNNSFMGGGDLTNQQQMATDDCAMQQQQQQQQRFKRRRMFDPSSAGEENNRHAFLPFHGGGGNNAFGRSSGNGGFIGNGNKRRIYPSPSPPRGGRSSYERRDSNSNSNSNPSMDQKKIDFLQNLAKNQQEEIAKLKSEKTQTETSYEGLKSEHAKVLNENKTLKRAVLIQQERQTQASTELSAAHRYKEEADDKIRKLEQLVLSLRYHLQSEHTTNTPFDDVHRGGGGGVGGAGSGGRGGYVF